MIKFGVVVSQDGLEYPVIKKIVSECERLGFDSIWFHDHLFFSSRRPYLECWTLLSALSTETRKLRLGTLVLCNSYRHPSLLAKMVATLDVISEGRLEFGIGAGWHKKEYLAYGFPFPRASVRIQQLDEALQIIKKMWTEEKTNFEGRYFSVKDAICKPKPVQKPHPPIWVGGTGKLLLEVVAKHANGSNFRGYDLSPEKYAERLKVLRGLCAKLGGDFGDIQKSLLTTVAIGKSKSEVANQLKRQQPSIREFMSYEALARAIRRPKRTLSFLISRMVAAPASTIVGTPDECIEKMRKYVDLGVTYFMLKFPCVENFKSLEVFAENVVPAFKAGQV